MEHIKLGLEILAHGVALFVCLGIAISLLGGAIGFIVWIFAKLREEKQTWQKWDK